MAESSVETPCGGMKAGTQYLALTALWSLICVAVAILFRNLSLCEAQIALKQKQQQTNPVKIKRYTG